MILGFLTLRASSNVLLPFFKDVLDSEMFLESRALETRGTGAFQIWADPAGPNSITAHAEAAVSPQGTSLDFWGYGDWDKSIVDQFKDRPDFNYNRMVERNRKALVNYSGVVRITYSDLPEISQNPQISKNILLLSSHTSDTPVHLLGVSDEQLNNDYLVWTTTDPEDVVESLRSQYLKQYTFFRFKPLRETAVVLPTVAICSNWHSYAKRGNTLKAYNALEVKLYK